MKLLTSKTLTFASAAVVGAAGLFCAIGATGATAKHKPPVGGPIHWWKFNGNGMDSAGEYDLTPIGPVDYVPAVMGAGIDLDGVNTGINMPAYPDLMFDGSFTISTWALLRSRPSGGKLWTSLIFCGDDRPGLDPYALQVGPDGKMTFLATGGSDAADVGAPFPMNRFVLVTAVYNKVAGSETLYYDGKPVAQNAGKTNLTPVVSLVENEKPGIGIGTNNQFQRSRYNFGWDGIINDMRIYNRPLTQSEVEKLYKEGVAASKSGGGLASQR